MPLSRGQRLRRIREQRGEQQKEAAAGIGIGGSYLSQLETDHKGTNLEQVRPTLHKAAAYYEVMREYFEARTPQEYMAFYVRTRADHTQLTSVGRRLRFVLDELHLRWGDEYSLERIAEAIGTSTRMLDAYRSDKVQFADDQLLQRLTEITGVPTRFFVPDAQPRVEGDPELRRVFEEAVAEGITARDLQLMIHTWLAARQRV